MNYQEEIKKHLEKYKNEHFKSIENGIWRKNKVSYPYILPIGEEKLNLLPIYREDTFKYLKDKKTKLHSGFHHLNSSQAMCLNFFFPLLKEKELEVVLKAIGYEMKNDEINYKTCCFEKESEIEKVNNKYRATSFDFYFKTKGGKNIFFEIKYTEQEFGKAKPDVTHKAKFDDVYKNKLCSFNEGYRQKTTFFENYQILRNLICISKDSYVVFLYPNNNDKIKKQAEFAKSNILMEDLKKNVINLSWEKLLCFTEKNIKNESIIKQISDFKDKYNINV